MNMNISTWLLHYLYGLPHSCILKLERIQNSAAMIIYRRKIFDNVTPLLKQSEKG